MNVLIVPSAEVGCALDARAVREVVVTGRPAVAPDGPEFDLARWFRRPESAAAVQVVLDVGGTTWTLRTGMPAGFHRIDPSRLVPVPAFLFRAGARPVRALFEWQGRPYLLLDESELARRAGAACT
jgi:hypothetical protein